MPDQALAGLRVVECAEFIYGPWCGRLLAGFGAEVIKVEPPGRGDISRAYGPFPNDRPNPDQSGLHIWLNNGKKSTTLDIWSARGRDQLHKLLKQTDLFIVDLKPSQLAQAGLTFEELQATNPNLVMVSITPFGLNSPYAEYKAHDLNIAATAGACVAGSQDREGLRPPVHGSSYLAGVAGAIGGLLAVLARSVTGRGQLVDVAAADVVTAFQHMRGCYFADHVLHGAREWRTGPRGIGPYPVGVHRCKDGYISVITVEEATWQRVLEMIGGGKVPEWYQSDPRFKDRRKYTPEIMDALDKLWEEWPLQYTKEEIFTMCQEKGIAWTPVYDAQEVLRQPHLRARNFFAKVAVPEHGEVEVPGPPFILSETPWEIAHAAPRLGQDNQVVSRQAEQPRPAVPFQLAANPASRGHSGHASNGGQNSTSGRLLRGIRVIDFTWVRAGPVLGHLFADMGAEVIKIESRRRPDLVRVGGLDYTRTGTATPSVHAESPTFIDFNRGKLAATLDFTQPEGRRLVERLVSVSDFLIENFTPGVLPRRGLGYEALKQINPGLIQIAMPAGGTTGPLKDIRTYNPTLRGLAGLDYLVGYHGEQTQGRTPLNLDDNSALYGYYAGMAALLYRVKTGKGQFVEVPQWETSTSTLGAEAILEHTFAHRVLHPEGNREHYMAPHNLYPCKGDDRWVSIAVATEEEWRSLCQAMGNPEWVRDPRFSSLQARLDHQEELDHRISGWTRQHEDRALAEQLQRMGVPAMPSLSIPDRVKDPHFQARKPFVTYEHPLAGTQWMTGVTWKMSDAPEWVVPPAPALGEHNEYVFGKVLGLSQEEIARLVKEQVIY